MDHKEVIQIRNPDCVGNPGIFPFMRSVLLFGPNPIFNYVHISFEVNIKNFSIISNFSDLGHNLVANDYSTIMPSVIIGGNCEIGEQTLIGSGSTIHQGVKIGSNCKIGMGTLITSNIKNNTSVINYPRQTTKENI